MSEPRRVPDDDSLPSVHALVCSEVAVRNAFDGLWTRKPLTCFFLNAYVFMSFSSAFSHRHHNHITRITMIIIKNLIALLLLLSLLCFNFWMYLFYVWFLMILRYIHLNDWMISTEMKLLWEVEISSWTEALSCVAVERRFTGPRSHGNVYPGRNSKQASPECNTSEQY
jgi:hypothetical protein